MKPVLILQAAILVSLSAYLGIEGSYHDLAGLLVGGLVAAVNFFVLGQISKGLLGKKSVAWSLSVIVFKYTILGLVLYLVAVKQLLPILWFAIGIGTLLIAIVIFGFLPQKHREE